MKLITEINQSEIRIQLNPFFKKVTKFSAIKKIELIDYGFMSGWELNGTPNMELSITRFQRLESTSDLKTARNF